MDSIFLLKIMLGIIILTTVALLLMRLVQMHRVMKNTPTENQTGITETDRGENP